MPDDVQAVSGGFEFTVPRFILCEGPDDKALLEALIKYRSGIPAFQVRHAAECNAKQTGGKTGFAPSLKGIRTITGFDQLQAILIVTDHDKSINPLKKYADY